MASRRTVLLGLGGLAVSGCATPGSAVYQVVDAYRALDRARKEYPFTKAVILAEPGGVLGVQVKDGLKGVMVWSQRENGLDYWRSGNGVLVVTRAGRVVKTSGFPNDLLASRLSSGVDPLGAPLNPQMSYEFEQELDYLPGQYGVRAEHRLSFVRKTLWNVFDEQRPVAEWRETVRLPSRRRRYEQRLLLDLATGAVLASDQYVGERLSVRFEMLKAPQPEATSAA